MGLSAVFRTRIRIHYSWIAVIIFMTAAVVTQFSTNYSLVPRVILGLLASVLFLVITVIRTYIIALVSHRRSVPVQVVTLFAVGSVLEMEQTAIVPALDVLIAATGMLTNLVIAGILFVAYQVLASTGSIMVQTVVQWLAFICLMTAFFNVLPGLPLDAGRFVRSVFWKATGNYERATRYLSWFGWVIGLGFVIGGIYLLVTTRQWFVAVLLALPGLILQNSATHNRREVDPKPRRQRRAVEAPDLAAGNEG